MEQLGRELGSGGASRVNQENRLKLMLANARPS